MSEVIKASVVDAGKKIAMNACKKEGHKYCVDSCSKVCHKNCTKDCGGVKTLQHFTHLSNQQVLQGSGVV